MAGVEDHHAVLDPGTGDGVVCSDYSEAEVTMNVTVVGMEKSGRAAVELLLEKGHTVRAADLESHAPVHGIPVEPQSATAFEKSELVVVSPGVPADLDLLNDARARGVPVIGELELASGFLLGDTIGITGANGKTTTTALTGHILRESG